MFGSTSKPPTLSMFGSSQSQPAASTGPSLFGGVGTSQAQPTPTPTSSLSTGLSTGNSLASQNTTQSQATQPQTSSLFGGLGGLGGQSKPQASSTLFGGLASTSQPQQQSSLLNSKHAFGTTQQTSMFGSTQTQQNQAAQSQQQQVPAQDPSRPKEPQPAYFDSLLERGRKRNHGANGVGFSELPSLQLSLGDIARRARELGTPTKKDKGADSRAHYLLAASGIQPGQTLRDLDALGQATGVAPSQAPPPDNDIDNYVSTLQSQSTIALIEDGLRRSARDFDKYLEENVTMEWEAQRKRIYEHFGLVPKEARADGNGLDTSAIGGSFGKSSRRGKGVDGRASNLGRSAFGSSLKHKSVIGTPAGAPGNISLFADMAEKAAGSPAFTDDRFLRNRQSKFCEAVQTLNISRLQEQVYPVLQEFAKIEEQSAADVSGQLVDAYKACMEIVQENPKAVTPSDPNAVRERQFSDDYLNENPNSAESIRMRKRIIEGSTKFLEKNFYQLLEGLIAKNPREASLGGIPTTINKIRAYIRLRASRKDLVQDNVDLQMIGDDYCWALVFYLLRSGYVKEAAEYVTTNATAFRSIDRNFVTYITSYANSPDRRLSRSLQDRINAEYQQRTRIAPENSIDPYRLACYKVIGRCDLGKRSLDGLNQGVEDWIWLQFNLAREVNRVEEAAGETFGLDEVRMVVRDIGQRHFSKGTENSGAFGTFFFLQVLGGMFEQAVAYLYPYNYVSAVHFAIALDFYGLLRVSDFNVGDSELLTFNTKELAQLSFGRMLGYYTRDFRAANAVAAADYLTLICLNADLPGQLGKSQSELCHEALRELVLETREFAKLLGDIRSDGRRIRGAIEQRLKLIHLTDQEEFLKTVTIQAAAIADDNGRTTDAVLLFHLAEEYDNVIEIINRALSDSLAIDLGQEQPRLQPLKPRAAIPGQQQEAVEPGSSLSLTSVDDPAVLAKNMIGLYNSNAMYFQKIRPSNRDACGVLLQMSEARSHVEAGRWATALDIITSLGILPLRAEGNVSVVRGSAQAFASLPPVVAHTVGPLLMWTITCCGRQRDALRASAFDIEHDATRREMADQLTAAARDLMVFAGLIRYKLPARVFEVLARAGQDVGVY